MGRFDFEENTCYGDGASTCSPSSNTTFNTFWSSKSILSVKDQFETNSGRLEDFYDVEKPWLLLHGSVRKLVHRHTSQIRAVRVLSKMQIKNYERLKRGVTIMKTFDHPNIIKLFDTFQDRRNIYLVMEHCQGGKLVDRITDLRGPTPLSETQAAAVMEQILCAALHLHEGEVCHQNISLDTIMLLTEEPLERNTLKLSGLDYLGCSRTCRDVHSVIGGAINYSAPEVLGLAGVERHSARSDIWSCGAIMYRLLCGYLPFRDTSDDGLRAKIRRGCLFFNPWDWKNISEPAKNMNRWLLKTSASERCTAGEALSHAWIVSNAPKQTLNPIDVQQIEALADTITNCLDEEQLAALWSTCDLRLRTPRGGGTNMPAQLWSFESFPDSIVEDMNPSTHMPVRLPCDFISDSSDADSSSEAMSGRASARSDDVELPALPEDDFVIDIHLSMCTDEVAAAPFTLFS